ncbi:plasmid mobilization protein [Flavobacterium psychrophilum]|uniref:plasmid mobilization protein n=1 Tax=Flavobacterium psychrophilum TaxID=96345 RepID=UPI001D06ED58|nr:hypothetical protein [Flavobacterium psychrophilum]EKT3957197.1 hypothetical protein [Flavobacterium psychrophilum]MCB6088259.1 hypothetical protein [Flavobacterium psychrophilum]MEB3378523.1 hypothetical protein [Flavobacterium psychrophilum]
MVNKTKSIMFRVTTIQKKIIEKKAKERKTSTAYYCRMVALERRDKTVFSDEEIKAFEDLHHIRNSFIHINNLLKNKDSNFANQVMKTVKNTESILKIFIDGRES